MLEKDIIKMASDIIEKINSFDSVSSLNDFYFSLGHSVLKDFSPSTLNLICKNYYSKKRELRGVV